MKPPLRIAILECDTPLAETKSIYGGYGGVFTELLKAGADELHKPELITSSKGMELSIYDVVNEDQYPNLLDIDAVLLTGSKHNSFEDDPWILRLVEFTKQVLAQGRVRIIGVCFGHQIIGRAMGIKVNRSPIDWEVSVCQVDLSPRGRQLFGLDKLNIFQMHRDIVFEYPNGVEPLGASPTCEVQGMYAPRRIISVQGHPEFNKQIVSEILRARHEQGIFDEERFKDGMARVSDHHDGVAVAKAFLQFLLED